MKVLKFSASWCGPCKMLARNLEDVNTNIPIDLNLGSSIFGGMGGNTGISGIGIYNSLPRYDSTSIPYSDEPFYNFLIEQNKKQLLHKMK